MERCGQSALWESTEQNKVFLPPSSWLQSFLPSPRALLLNPGLTSLPPRRVALSLYLRAPADHSPPRKSSTQWKDGSHQIHPQQITPHFWSGLPNGVHGSTRALFCLVGIDRLSHSGNKVLRAATLSHAIPTPTTASVGTGKTEWLAAACD